MTSIRLERRGAIAVVWLARAEKRNALSVQMLDDLVSTARLLKKDRSLRGVILAGEGASFCAGLDLPSIFASPKLRLRAALALLLPRVNIFQKVSTVWRELPVPVVAAISGHCYGAGLQIALGADWLIAHEQAELSIMEAKWGMVPDMGISLTLRQRLSRAQAKRLAMSAELIQGAQALKLGLIDQCASDPVAAAEQYLEALMVRSPDAVGAAKQLFDRMWLGSARAGLALERRWQLRLVLGANHKRAVAANKRKTPAEFGPREIG